MDKRVDKTLNLIEMVFIQKLKTKELSKITVTEICRDCHINRGTFYLHYKDIYDLLDQLVDQTCQDLLLIFKEHFPSTNQANQESLLNAVFDYLQSNQEKIRLLLALEEQSHFQQKLESSFHHALLWEDGGQVGGDFDYVEVRFILSGIMGVLLDWIKTDFATDRSKLKDYLLILIRRE